MKRNEWNEFRESGLLYFVNCIMKANYWEFCLETDRNHNITDAFPTKYICDINEARKALMKMLPCIIDMSFGKSFDVEKFKEDYLKCVARR